MDDRIWFIFSRLSYIYFVIIYLKTASLWICVLVVIWGMKSKANIPESKIFTGQEASQFWDELLDSPLWHAPSWFPGHPVGIVSASVAKLAWNNLSWIVLLTVERPSKITKQIEKMAKKNWWFLFNVILKNDEALKNQAIN